MKTNILEIAFHVSDDTRGNRWQYTDAWIDVRFGRVVAERGVARCDSSYIRFTSEWPRKDYGVYDCSENIFQEGTDCKELTAEEWSMIRLLCMFMGATPGDFYDVNGIAIYAEEEN